MSTIISPSPNDLQYFLQASAIVRVIHQPSWAYSLYL